MILEPRGPSTAPVIHLAALVAALAWTSYLARFRPPTRGTWRLTAAAGAASALGDALLVVSVWSTGLAAVPLVIGFVLGVALLIVALLQGWPSRGVVAVGLLALLGPFVLWW